MVCPVCVTTAIIANAPAIAGAMGGFAAVKVALDRRNCVNRPKPVAQEVLAPTKPGGRPPPTLLDLPPMLRYDVDD